MSHEAQTCAGLIREANAIAVLTGAGISTNAGIPDFRGPKGLYITKKYDPDTVFDINAFYRDPEPFYAFARDFIELEKTIKPTFTHSFLSKLEESGKLKGNITQNIDALHQKAGSKNVLEMHGSFWTSRCVDCGKMYTYEKLKDHLITSPNVPCCDCQGTIKPDIVFFGENVKYFEESIQLAASVDLFFVIGTSCVVFPAAMIPSYVTGKIVVVNLSEVRLNASNVSLAVQDDIDRFFKEVAGYLEKENNEK